MAKMRRFLSLIALVLVSVMILSSCSFAWQDENEIKAIKEIKRAVDTNGKVYLEIYYTDDSSPDRFEIPKGVSIEDITSEYSTEERKTTVTITYSDGQEPYVFDIPDGVDGASITDVDIVEKDTGKYLVFSYKDSDNNELESWEVSISHIKGDDGKDGQDGATWLFGEGAPTPLKVIDETQSGNDAGNEQGEEAGQEGEDQGETENQGEPEDQEESGEPDDQPIVEPVVGIGKEGDFYLDVVSYDVYLREKEGWVLQGNIKSTGITSIEGFSEEDGRSGYEVVTSDVDSEGNVISYKLYSSAIKDMQVVLNGNYYEYTITIVDAQGGDLTLDTIMVERPAGWLSGNNFPKDSEGINGDFYYCIGNNTIYTKRDNSWEEVVNLKSANPKCSIKFNLRGGMVDEQEFNFAYWDKSDSTNYCFTIFDIKQNTYYPTTLPFPVPTKEGYKFLGWYKTIAVNPSNTMVHGAFNDMTLIVDSLELFAIWEEI